MNVSNNNLPHRCMWYEQCPCVEVCENFSPIDDEITDEELSEAKYEYRKEFFEYEKENDNYDRNYNEY